MRIQELLLETYLNQLDEITRPFTVRSAAEILYAAGYKRLGIGSFGSVYSKPGEQYVLKLFTSLDRAYMAFVKLAQSNPNSHFPRFKGKMMKITDTYYAIRMERLGPLTIYKDADIIYNYSMSIASRRPYPEEFKETALANMKQLDKFQPGIKKACDLVVKKLGKKYVIDMHGANIMQRGDNTIVISDPVA